MFLPASAQGLRGKNFLPIAVLGYPVGLTFYIFYDIIYNGEGYTALSIVFIAKASQSYLVIKTISYMPFSTDYSDVQNRWLLSCLLSFVFNVPPIKPTNSNTINNTIRIWVIKNTLVG